MITRPVAAAAVVAAAVAALPILSTTAEAAPGVRHFANCTALHRSYPHGVGKPGAHDHVSGSTAPVTNFKRSRPLYRANHTKDRDHDGIACEAH